MPVAEIALERFVPDHLETDLWQGGLDSQATKLSDLRVLHASPDLSRLFEPPWLTRERADEVGRHASADTPLDLVIFSPSGTQPTDIVPIRLMEQN